jgi:hypothetical protein
MHHNRVVVVCPSNVTTGGPEALHQLVDSINRQGGYAAMLYQPTKWDVPKLYSGYQIRICKNVVDTDVVVVPEIWPDRVVHPGRKVLWWLSVDFASPQALSSEPSQHVAQSVYAQHWLANHGVSALMLTDYVNPMFYDKGVVKQKKVAVNPAKGKDLIDRFRVVCPDIEVVELVGFSRTELVDVLNECLVYVDFGHHPGRDRLPREAALCGATVFINRVGAGNFEEDYNVDDWYRFDSTELEVLGSKIRQCFESPTQQEKFRIQIQQQKDVFDRQVKELFL